VKPAWQEDVRQAIKKRGLTEKALAKRVGCAQSTLHDMLNNPDASHSSLVPAVHEALGWDPPPDPQESPPLPSADAIEMAHLFDRLPEHIRRQLRDQARTYIDLLKKGDGERD
jgi:lambda repressor-like predicted transcriptional regulator